MNYDNVFASNSMIFCSFLFSAMMFGAMVYLVSNFGEINSVNQFESKIVSMVNLKDDYSDITYGSDVAVPPLTFFNTKDMFGKFPLYIILQSKGEINDKIKAYIGTDYAPKVVFELDCYLFKCYFKPED